MTQATMQHDKTSNTKQKGKR